MIIGINGKIGSGKDTVGRIIQYLTSEYDTRYVYADWIDRVENYSSDPYSPWEIKKFAGKLKTMASLLTGIPVEMFEDQEFKKTNLESSWDVKSKYRDRKPPKPMTVREFLQKLGTEAMRDGLHTNVWVNALFADYIYTKNCGCEKNCRCEHDLPNWIITDMRFPNEMEAIVTKGGITIRVVRQYSKEALLKGSSPYIKDEELSKKLSERYKYMSDLPVVNIHPSETALDDHTMHYDIINDGTIEDLIEKVREVLIKENII